MRVRLIRADATTVSAAECPGTETHGTGKATNLGTGTHPGTKGTCGTCGTSAVG